MKIALTMGSVSRLSGGLLEANRRLAQAWHEQGTQVLVMGVEDQFTEADLEVWSPVKPTVFRRRGPARLDYAPAMSEALAAFSPDIVHSQGLWTYPSWLAARWQQNSSGREVIHPHGMLDTWALKNSARKKRLMGALFERRHIHNASCLRALCHSELESIRAYGYQGPICIVPNGMDLPQTSMNGKSLHLPSRKKVLLYLGRLHPKKGLANLIRAWAALSDPGDWVLAIAGWDDGDHEVSLRQLTQDLRLYETVLFLGSKFGSDKDELYQSCEAFVLPSLSEGLPMVILEAWAHAKPVLMTPMCNLPEGFAHGAALVTQPEVLSLTHSLRQMMALSDLERQDMGAAGRRLVRDHFSWQRVVESLSAVNHWLAHGGAAPSCIY